MVLTQLSDRNEGGPQPYTCGAGRPLATSRLETTVRAISSMRCCDPTWTRLIYTSTQSPAPPRGALSSSLRGPRPRRRRSEKCARCRPCCGARRALLLRSRGAAAPRAARRTPHARANAPRPRPRLTLTAKWDACRSCEAPRGGGTGAGRASRAPRSSCSRALLLQQTLWQRAGWLCCARLGASSAPLATRCTYDVPLTAAEMARGRPEGASAGRRFQRAC